MVSNVKFGGRGSDVAGVAAPLRRWWCVLTSWRAGLSVGHAGCCSLLHEMFGKEEPAAMMFVDFQHEGRPVVRCLFGAGPVPEAYSSYRSEIARKTQLPRPDGRLSSLVGGAEVGKKRVCTMCTPWASDRVVLVPDWAGLRRFSGEWRIFKGWNPVRVPPRARVFPVQGLFGVFSCAHCAHSRL